MSRYLDIVRGQQRRGGFQITSKTILTVIAVVAMVSSAVYWWGVQSQLTSNVAMSIAFTAILVLAPPVLVSFLIPWSPGGMLLQKINARTWGYAVVIFAALFLIYYSFEIQYTWWAAQPVVSDTGLIWQQVLVGIIGFIVIPALIWTPVTSEELVEQVRQAHLVKRYEMQAQADIAILRGTLLRAQEKALKGFANLTADEREELAIVMQGLVKGIDKTLKEVGQSVKIVSDATIPFNSLEDNEDIREYLDYIHETLVYNSLTEEYERRPAPASAAHAHDSRARLAPPVRPQLEADYEEELEVPPPRRQRAPAPRNVPQYEDEYYEEQAPPPRRRTRPLPNDYRNYDE